MSIEAALKELTEAVKENTAVQAGILQTIKKGSGAAAPAADKADKPAAAAKATKPAAAKATKPAAITIDKLRKVFTDFLGVPDKALRAERRDQVAAICEHFGVDRATAIEEENWAEAIKAVKAYESGGTPDFVDAAEDEAEEDESDDDGSLV